MMAPGTEAQATDAEGNYVEGQSTFTSQDGRRLRIGLPDGNSLLIGWPKAEAAVGPLSTAGNTTLVATSGHALHTCVVSAGAGAGAFTRVLVLPATESGAVDVLDGTFYEVLVELPASANPTVEVRNETSGGTLLWTRNSGGVAETWLARFHRTGGAWKAWGATLVS